VSEKGMTSLSAGMESRMQSAWETPYETCCEIHLKKNNMKPALKGFLVAAREMPLSKENKNTKQSA
jgi:hypothetical protein